MPVARTNPPLLDQIDRDALDDRVPLTTTLRKCIALGAQARNDELRDWASKELNGYHDDLPDYRTIYVPLMIDAVTATHQVRGQQISPMILPDFARDVITEEMPLVQGVGDLQAQPQSSVYLLADRRPPRTGPWRPTRAVRITP